MEGIEHLKKYLLTVHPVRKTSAQKAEFRQWLLRELKRAGWKAGEETYGKFNGSVNVTAGDPERAEVFLCAHYDTGSRMLASNFVSPTNVMAHVCYHLAAALVSAFLCGQLSLEPARIDAAAVSGAGGGGAVDRGLWTSQSE